MKKDIRELMKKDAEGIITSYTKNRKVDFLKVTLPSILEFMESVLRMLVNLAIISAFVVLGYLLGIKECEGKTIYYGSETETITLIYGGPTIFRFNDEVQTHFTSI